MEKMVTVTNFVKVINPISKKAYGRLYNSMTVFCKIEFKNGNLSITGVEGPLPNGNCMGSCGQIVMSLLTEDRTAEEWRYNEPWTAEMMTEFLAIWDKWHLNDMRAECEHQRKAGIKYNDDPNNVCPECGYKIGHSWLREEVPAGVIEFLYNLPDSPTRPYWV